MQDRIKELMAEVEQKFGMGGLSSGIYGEFAAEVAQAIARECAEIAAQTTEYGALDEHGETKAYATEAAIRARFGLGE